MAAAPLGRQHTQSQSKASQKKDAQQQPMQPAPDAHKTAAVTATTAIASSFSSSSSGSSSHIEGPVFPNLVRATTLPATLRPTTAINGSAATVAVAAASGGTLNSGGDSLGGEDGLGGSVSGIGVAVRRADPYHLAPEDAFYTVVSPPWDRARGNGNTSQGSGNELLDMAHTTSQPSLRRLGSGLLLRRNGSGGLVAASGGGGREGRSRSRRRRQRTWKKLLWVKQSYPDNYTDQATFLENLQRNPRLKPYEFWPLVADSTVIVQHVCSVIVFVVCFVGIFQERVSPVAVVGWGTIATCLGWLMWEWWAGQELDSEDLGDDGGRRLGMNAGGQVGDGDAVAGTVDDARAHTELTLSSLDANDGGTDSDLAPPPAPLSSPTLHPTGSSTTSFLTMLHKHEHGHGGNGRTHSNGQRQYPPSSMSKTRNGRSGDISPTTLRHVHSDGSLREGNSPLLPSPPSSWRSSPSSWHGSRFHHRIGTIKSAILIYFTLLGLSPILKSLTRSTSSDSIWAMSFWLLTINIFFFDYSGVWVGAHKFPVASLSTNAALMASTVLASRLPSTGQVFSLTLFSIEVFGLFPVFRRYARHSSWRYHVLLTVLLVLGAGAGVGIVLTRPGGLGLPWRGAVAGMVVACLLSAVAMGGCSWWLIGLQKYKNEIYGPWDPARPIIISRRHWDD